MNLRWLLLFIPIAIALTWLKANPILVFFASALAIVPLAGLVGDATEALSRFLGATIGGLLNATLGNAPEIIIGFFALKHGLVDMVKASITGSIVGNLLFGLGISIAAGGLRIPKQTMSFDLRAAHIQTGLLMVTTFGLIIPAVFDFSTTSEREISLHIAVVLFLAYLVSVVVTMTMGNPDVPANSGGESNPPRSEGEEMAWSRNKALGILASVTVGLAVMSEIMTDALDPAAKSMGFTPLFAGVFLLALVGNTSELINSVRFARQNQFDLSLGITVGGSSQMALLVAPLLVFFGIAIGQNMNLLFSPFELVAIILTVYAVINILHAGTVRWAAGFFLVAVYIMLGIGFYYVPAATAAGL
ncbi:MAG TPA: calcium/proton exchanger [Methylococcaceae bacterium]|jgi:Ca2+:H+ antiporter|nr:calcium/proton exchanger [Methylococcaceae bacterium]